MWKKLDVILQPQSVTQHPMKMNLSRHPAKPVKLRRAGITCQQQIEGLQKIVMAEIIETRGPSCQAQEFISSIRAHFDIMDGLLTICENRCSAHHTPVGFMAPDRHFKPHRLVFG